MTVNKEKWQEIAKKYDTKAKWADAILLLNLEEHEDLISALIELDPHDLLEAEEDGYQVPSVSPISTINISKLEPLYDHSTSLAKAEETMEAAKNRIDEIERKSDEALNRIEELLTRPRDITINSSYPKVSTEEMIKTLKQELERGLRSR